MLAPGPARRCAACGTLCGGLQHPLAAAGNGPSGPVGPFIAPDIPVDSCGNSARESLQPTSSGDGALVWHNCRGCQMNFAGATIYGADSRNPARAFFPSNSFGARIVI